MDNFESNAEKWYESKLGFLAIVFFPILAGTIAVVLYVGKMETTIAVQGQEFADFKNNDITHIELEIAEIKQAQVDQGNITQTQNAKIIEILTTLKLNAQPLAP